MYLSDVITVLNRPDSICCYITPLSFHSLCDQSNITDTQLHFWVQVQQLTPTRSHCACVLRIHSAQTFVVSFTLRWSVYTSHASCLNIIKWS